MSEAKNITQRQGPALITGGAGFIGTNLANRILEIGRPVWVYDNLSRPGVEQNWDWLKAQHGSRVRLWREDVRDADALKRAVREASVVYHFAAQVAVTTSLVDPIADFEINARGTLNLLEALRALRNPPPLIYTSSNKIYGELDSLKLTLVKDRYEPEDPKLRLNGFGEDTPLQFRSPYGCSKGAACQYVLDYARTFGLKAVVYCMSCIYGLHQFGNEDQGWVAHFLIRAMRDEPITIFGDGRQVRDILFVDDLVDALILGQNYMSNLSGRCYNIGGGPDNSLSLLELLDLIAELHGHRPKVEFRPWRAADQRYYVSDVRNFCRATGWTPVTSAREGVKKLYDWLASTNHCLEQELAVPAGGGKAGYAR